MVGKIASSFFFIVEMGTYFLYHQTKQKKVLAWQFLSYLVHRKMIGKTM
jgi:hypothetical protein